MCFLSRRCEYLRQFRFLLVPVFYAFVSWASVLGASSERTHLKILQAHHVYIGVSGGIYNVYFSLATYRLHPSSRFVARKTVKRWEMKGSAAIRVEFSSRTPILVGISCEKLLHCWRHFEFSCGAVRCAFSMCYLIKEHFWVPGLEFLSAPPRVKVSAA